MTARELRRWLEVKPDAVSDELAFALLDERAIEPDRHARSRIWQALEADLALPPMAAFENSLSGSGEPTRAGVDTSRRGAAMRARLLGVSLLLLAAAGSVLWRTESDSRVHDVAKPAPAAVRAQATSSSEATPAGRVVSADAPASSPATLQPAAKATRMRAKRSSALPSVLNTASPAPAAVDDPNAELELLARARRVIASTPERALALTDEHLAHFPAGTFALEREVLAIDALRRIGRQSEAQERAARFVREHPNSVHAARVEGMLQAP